MYNLNFHLTNKFYIYLSLYADDGRVEETTGVKITPVAVPPGVKNKLAYIIGAGLLSKAAKNKIDALRIQVDRYVQQAEIAGMPILRADVQAVIRDSGIRRKDRRSKILVSLSEVYGKFTADVESGAMMYDGKRYSVSAIHIYKAIGNKLAASPIGKVPISNITIRHLQAFSSYLIGLGLSQNTVSAYNNNLVYFFRKTYKTTHQNAIFKEDNLLISSEEIDYAVYYSEDELERMYAHPIAKDAELRDLFVYGCYTCLRYSDLSRVESIAIRDGFIELNMQKTGKTIHVPLHPIARKIWDKYGGQLPDYTMAQVNIGIKKICEDAGFVIPVLFKRTQGGKLYQQHRPKWQLTTSHTMRRSFATNAWLAGMPTEHIMAIGGWRTEVSFRKYLRMTQKDKAKKAAGHTFFTGGPSASPTEQLH